MKRVRDDMLSAEFLTQSPYAAIYELHLSDELLLNENLCLFVWSRNGVVSLDIHPGFISLMDNDCLILPDQRHITIWQFYNVSTVYGLIINKKKLQEALTSKEKGIFSSMQMEDKLYVMDGSAKLYHYPDSEPLVDCIRFLISDFAEDYKLGDIDIVLVDILRLLIRLSRLPQKSFEPASTATQADKAIWVMRYIRENYASATLIEAAKELHYSPDYLSTLIADACGMSFSTLLNLRRAIVGREYLIDNSLSQQEVAVRLGYQSYSGFYSSFKRFFGVSPTEYRSAYKLFAIQSSEKI